MLFSSEYHSFEKKQTGKLQMNTARNEMKQEEKRKRRVVGIGILQLLGVLSFSFFKSMFIVIKREGRVKRPWDELLGVRCS